MEKCSHPLKKISKIISSEDGFFCQNCGLILYQGKNNKYINTIKPNEIQSKTEIDPIDLFENAYKNTPFISIKKDSIYPTKRTRAIKLLEKFNNIYHFSDEIFFLALTYMDYIFKYIYEKNKTIKKKTEELYILNCLIISEKFYDKDVTIIPEYSLYIKHSIYDVDAADIKENEIDCLKILKYKLDHHSLYDILKAFKYNGFILEKEIDNHSIGYQIKFAYNYAEKLFRDIVFSYITIFYPPHIIAFVIIVLTRKKFFDSKYTKRVKKIYGIRQNDYKDCYEEIKRLLNLIEKGLKVSDCNNPIRESDIDQDSSTNKDSKDKENEEQKKDKITENDEKKG